jgi:Tfp pilus assembly protein PilN
MRIEINLLPGAKKKKTGGGGFTMPDFSELAGAIKDPLLLGAIGAWVVAIVFMGFVFVSVNGQVSDLESQAELIRAEAERHADMLQEQRRAMDLRDSLVAELDAIRAIDADRYVWPHIMQEVTRALPDFTWLVGLQTLAVPTAIGDSGPPPPVRFRLDGRTSEIAAYTRFLRQLANSPWVALVEDGPARRVTEDGRNMTSFEVTVTFQWADSAYILTVPVTESVN